MAKTILTLEEVAERLRVNRNTLRTYIKEKGMPHIRIGKRMIRVDEDAFEAWLEKQSVNESE